MNAQSRHLRKSDWICLVMGTVFLVSTLGAVGAGGRRRAKEAVCQSNLRQWDDIFHDYMRENEGRFYTGIGAQGYAWIGLMEERYRSPGQNRLWFCPEAVRPLLDKRGNPTGGSDVFSAWGFFMEWTWSDLGEDGIAGSYGLNGYTLRIPDSGSYEGNVSPVNGWRDLQSVPHPATVPLFVDALRFDLWPKATDLPTVSEVMPWSSNNMARCCINRHNGAVNCLFVDGSVRKVGLKELWTLKWHRSFDTAGPWTKAAGVRPGDWPQWMSGFRDY
jgi:prepilin-type processing-associated H-X9-DG protein